MLFFYGLIGFFWNPLHVYITLQFTAIYRLFPTLCALDKAARGSGLWLLGTKPSLKSRVFSRGLSPCEGRRECRLGALHPSAGRWSRLPRVLPAPWKGWAWLQWGINNSLLSLGNSRAPGEELGCWDHLLPSRAGAETFLVKQPWEDGTAASLRGCSPSEEENLNLSSKYDTKPLLSVPGKGCETSFMISFIIPSKWVGTSMW